MTEKHHPKFVTASGPYFVTGIAEHDHAECVPEPHKCGDGTCEYDACVTSFHVPGASDSGGFDADDQPCRCERCPTNKPKGWTPEWTARQIYDAL